MDEFGVLTERFGLKPQGKSAPMAASKRDTSNGTTRDFSSNSGLNSKSPSYGQNQNSFSGGFPDDILFQSNTSNKKTPGGYDDFFDQFQTSTNKSSNGSSLDYDSIFMGSSNSGSKIYAYGNDDDDIFGLKKTTNDDVFGSFVSPPKKSDSVDDLLGGFGGGAESKLKSPKQDEAGFDDLISGFGASTSTNNGTNAKAAKSSYLSAEDPFVVLESTSSPAYGSSNSFTDPLDELGKLTQSSGRKSDGPSKASTTLKPPPKPSQVLKADKVQNPVVSSIDELEDFAMGKVRNSPVRSSVHAPKETSEWHSAKPSKYKEAEDATRKTPKESEDDLESFFSMSIRSSSAPKSRAAAPDAAFDAKTNRKGPGVAQRKPSGSSPNIKKASSTTNLVDDFSSVFGEIASVFGEFEEYEGESEERRRARLGRRQRTHDRMAKAVADMNQRDFQTQQEQEEKRRIADALDIEIKSWAAGKEGNMRALLSSLQYVLWPECGWEPVSLTDLITSSSVKKVYRKATLFVHPDKVQQKGATVQQKFIAEKVFDILKIGQGVPMTSDELVDMANSWVKTSFIGVQKSKMWSLGQVQKLNTGQWLLLLLNCIGSERCYAIYVFNCLLLQSYGVTILEHVEVDYHFIRENVVNKDIQVISTQDQVANIFTKGKTAMQFIFLRKKLTVINLLINWGGVIRVTEDCVNLQS